MSFFEQIGYLIKNYYKTFLSGLGITILLAVVGTFVGLILGMILALGRNLKPNKNDNVFIKILKIICSKLCLIYIEVFRGTPMMVQALIIFFGGYALGISWNPIICGLVIISLNTAAYMAEIVRSGINSVDNGQIEAARSLGTPVEKYQFLTISLSGILCGLGNVIWVGNNIWVREKYLG